MPDSTPRGEASPPLWWKIVAGLIVFGIVISVSVYVERRSAAPPPPALPTPLP